MTLCWLQLDLNKPLELQGPFDIILHKLTDQISRSQGGCADAQQQIDRFQVTGLTERLSTAWVPVA